MPAQPSLHGYRSFPPEYFTILDRVEALTPSGEFRIGPFAKKDALAGRRSFYRFRNALNEEAEKGDEYASRYKDIANLLKIEILGTGPSARVVIPIRNTEPIQPTAWYIIFTLNPLVSAVRRLEETGT